MLAFYNSRPLLDQTRNIAYSGHIAYSGRQHAQALGASRVSQSFSSADTFAEQTALPPSRDLCIRLFLDQTNLTQCPGNRRTEFEAPNTNNYIYCLWSVGMVRRTRTTSCEHSVTYILQIKLTSLVSQRLCSGHVDRGRDFL